MQRWESPSFVHRNPKPRKTQTDARQLPFFRKIARRKALTSANFAEAEKTRRRCGFFTSDAYPSA